jgi:hypothetical protein
VYISILFYLIFLTTLQGIKLILLAKNHIADLALALSSPPIPLLFGNVPKQKEHGTEDQARLAWSASFPFALSG